MPWSFVPAVSSTCDGGDTEAGKMFETRFIPFTRGHQHTIQSHTRGTFQSRSFTHAQAGKHTHVFVWTHNANRTLGHTPPPIWALMAICPAVCVPGAAHRICALSLCATRHKHYAQCSIPEERVPGPPEPWGGGEGGSDRFHHWEICGSSFGEMEWVHGFMHPVGIVQHC